MTYQELYAHLQGKYAVSSNKFLELDAQLSKTNGFGEFHLLPTYLVAKEQWQIDSNNYWNFLSLIKGKSINPNDDVQL